MDILIRLRPSVYKTRILESIDVEVPSWAFKSSSTESREPVAEPDPVSSELLCPGATYWPSGYLCDPVSWILRQIQVRHHCAAMPQS